MKNVQLLIVDPENDFCHPKGSLYVTNANSDMERLANLIDRIGEKLFDINVTLDAHHLCHISLPLFWKDRSGKHPSPFTLITSEDVERGIYRATKPSLQAHALKYVKSLAKNNRYCLCIWPNHTIIGTWGSQVYEPLMNSLLKWSEKNFSYCNFVTKGSNILTEHYSAVVADVPDGNDPSTQLNIPFIETINNADIVLCSGEALSHCVANTCRDLVNHFADDSLVKKMVLLEDCSSSVPGFEQLGKDFVKEMVGRGMQVTTSKDFLA